VGVGSITKDHTRVILGAFCAEILGHGLMGLVYIGLIQSVIVWVGGGVPKANNGVY
jgi:hypothetical protein